MKGAVVSLPRELMPKENWGQGNYMYFPHELRNAIAGLELPGCSRSLLLSGIDGDCGKSFFGGQRVHLNFRVEETGKLSGTFEVGVDINLDAARALAATLEELVKRAESTRPS